VEIGETLLVHTREAWRDWLSVHHGSKREIWLISYKKGSGKQALDYDTALDEALCFGWIDSQIKGVDAISFVTRWSPRRPRGSWTAGNRAKARMLIDSGRMTEAGIAPMPPELRAELGLPPR
jgi:uncharacterized protein YdeI (YjbR/CyaY-like superfamily)